MTPEIEQLRAVLDRLVAIRVSQSGALEEDEGHIMMCLGTLQFLATDLRESRMAQVKITGAVR